LILQSFFIVPTETSIKRFNSVHHKATETVVVEKHLLKVLILKTFYCYDRNTV